ncbi:Signal transduction histidine kinase [Hyphomicrobium sulfonivorans]|uniref:histidine kinase n=1 Tax=Hyphomicrobium sulfonivorans TaxID=121290 RepID=A0A109BBD9_HYPSL|nr:ATP-binding protein [Hyphomicrobium sulfonivorans]KWT65495.1 Signal transduction histidine kinase [Hyphomicrobium sulfonivorans]
MRDASDRHSVNDAQLAAIWAGLDATDDGIFVWSAERVLVFINEGFRRNWDLPVRAGMNYEEYASHIAHSQEWMIPGGPDERLQNTLNNFGVATDADYECASGHIVHVRQRPSAQGGMVVTFTDVTAIKRNERELREAKEAAEAMDEAKSRFLRAANHDLRQPLASLKILIYSCVREQDDEKRAEMLHAMGVATSIMEDLLGALLQIGQLDAGRVQPRITSFQLSELFERLRIQFNHQASEKGLRLRFVAPSKTVATDRALLERILSNFVGNAIRFTELGGVLIGCRKEGHGLRIDVIDTGRGIRQEDFGRIFEEFYRVTDNNQIQKKGLGLGLNIAKRLADLLELPIGLRSEVGSGSTFSVWVPLGNIWHSNISAEVDISETVAGEFAGIPMLLIEDDDFLRESMTQLLRRWGIDVHAAANEDEALELVADSEVVPRMIIADYNLEVRTGPDVIAAIRAATGEETPAIIVTADAEPRVIAGIREAGIPVLIKPVSPPRLRVMMHNLLFEPDLLKSADI